MHRSLPKFSSALLIVSSASACIDRPVSATTPVESTFAAQAALSTMAIDFGEAPCVGTSPKDATLTIANTGTIALDFDAFIASPAFTLPALQEGTLNPGESNVIQVHAVAIDPIENEETVKLGELLVDSNDPNQSRVRIPLAVKASAAPCFL